MTLSYIVVWALKYVYCMCTFAYTFCTGIVKYNTIPGSVHACHEQVPAHSMRHAYGRDKVCVHVWGGGRG